MFVGASLVGSLLASLSISIGPGDHIHAISDRSTVAPLLLPALPSAPQNLQAVAGDGQVTLTWDPPSDDGGAPILLYTIYRGNSSGGESFLITVPLVTTYIDLTVSNGVLYFYQVSATNAVGEGPRSNEASATPNPPATAPGAPQGLGATAGDATIALAWSPPGSDGGSPITNYRIYRGNSSGGESFRTEIGNVLVYSDIGLANGMTYYYKVSAVNAVGEGAMSTEASATPTAPVMAPGAPRNLQATPGDGQVTLNWQAPSNDGGSPILLYTIYRGNSSGGESFLITVPLVTTYTDATVTNGVTYYYQVSATNAIGEGPRSSEVSATPNPPATPPGAPQGLSAVPGDATVSLIWAPPASNGGSPITNYKIYRGTTSGGETLRATIGNQLSYSDTGLTNGVTYYYEVSAVNAAGEGPRSIEASATPSAPPTPPSAPQGLGATAGDATVTLTWSAPSSNGGSPITNYKIYRGTSSNGETLKATIANVLTYSDPAVTNGVTYYYQVSAVNAAGEGPRSNEASATPSPPPPPNAPPTVDFTWTPTSGDTTTVFTFTATASDDHDPPNTIQVRWDWTGDGTWDTTWSTTKTASHTFSSPGSYTVVVQAKDSGGLTATQSHTIIVTAPPPPGDFSISASPTSLHIVCGSSGSSGITLTSLNGLSGTASLSASISSSGLVLFWPTVSVSPSSVTLPSGGTATSTLTVSTSALTTPGTYTVTVTATIGSISHSVDVTVLVTLT